jgi:hypothetical protein
MKFLCCADLRLSRLSSRSRKANSRRGASSFSAGEHLAEWGALRSGIGVHEARELMWMLISRDVYRVLTGAHVVLRQIREVALEHTSRHAGESQVRQSPHLLELEPDKFITGDGR